MTTPPRPLPRLEDRALRPRDLVRFDMSVGIPTALEILRERLDPVTLLRVLAHYARASLTDPLGALDPSGWEDRREALVRHQLRAALRLDDALRAARVGEDAGRDALLADVIATTGARFIAASIELPDRRDWAHASPEQREAFIRLSTRRFFNARMDTIHATDEVLGFDVAACRFAQHLEALGKAHLTPMFCAADAVFFGDSDVSLTREHTLAAGGPACTFRFRFASDDISQ